MDPFPPSPLVFGSLSCPRGSHLGSQPGCGHLQEFVPGAAMAVAQPRGQLPARSGGLGEPLVQPGGCQSTPARRKQTQIPALKALNPRPSPPGQGRAAAGVGTVGMSRRRRAPGGSAGTGALPGPGISVSSGISSHIHADLAPGTRSSLRCPAAPPGQLRQPLTLRRSSQAAAAEIPGETQDSGRNPRLPEKPKIPGAAQDSRGCREQPEVQLSRATLQPKAAAPSPPPRLRSEPRQLHPRSLAAPAQPSPAPALRHLPNPPASGKGPGSARWARAPSPEGASCPPHAAGTCQPFPARPQLRAEPGMERRGSAGSGGRPAWLGGRVDGRVDP